MKSGTYLFLNYTITGVILVILLYSLIYNPDKTYRPVRCIHEELLGARCPICGMLNGFSAILKGRFSDAITIQPNSIRAFLFLFVLLLMRITAVFLLLKTHISFKILFNMDVILSLALFILTFKSMIPQIFYIYYKMLITGNGA